VSENPNLLAARAATSAAAGKFLGAINTIRRVINILEKRGSTTERARHRERLKLYQEKTAHSLSRGWTSP
jgi:hypothetical protein